MRPEKTDEVVAATDDSILLSADVLQVMGAVSDVVRSPVFLVGGTVRDLLLNRPSGDLDFATPLAVDTVEHRVRERGLKAYVAGRRFGTIGFKACGSRVEVTTFRAISYAPGRRAPEVGFVDDLDEDLAHREFTINAMATDGVRLMDPTGGRADLQASLIRAVGSPRERFREDPIRMLRAARFASELGFSVEERTAKAINESAHRILYSARERWSTELDALLVGCNCGAALVGLAETGLLRYLLPELQLQLNFEQNSPYHDRSLFEHTVAVVERTPREVDLRWAALLHDVGKPFVRSEKPDRSTYVHHEVLGAELVDRLGLYLKWSNERRNRVIDLVRTHMAESSPLYAADQESKVPTNAARKPGP